MPISDLLSSGLPFEWPEVVALVQELGDGLKNSGPSRSLLPLEAVTLEPDGRLRASVQPGTVPIVRSLAHVLNQLLASHPGPANLRLIALQANSDASTFGSVRELTQALAHFERPGRLKALSALYERARAAGLPASPVVAPPKVDVHPQPTPPPRRAAEPENQDHERQPAVKRRPKRATIVAFGVAAACLALTGVAVAIRARPQPVSAPQAAVEEMPNSPVPDGGTAEPPARSSRSSPARAAARPGTASARVQRPGVPTGDVASVAAMGSAVASGDPVRSSAGPAQISPIAEQEFVRARTLFERQQFAAAAAGFQRVIDILSNGELSPSSSTLRSTATELAAISLAAVSAIPDARVYTRFDQGVIEPVPMRQFLPPAVTPGAAAGELSVLELVIDSRGFVESVRLQNPQNRLRDKWWLNAAKTWRFQPASKDGQPVKFLKRIPLAAF